MHPCPDLLFAWASDPCRPATNIPYLSSCLWYPSSSGWLLREDDHKIVNLQWGYPWLTHQSVLLTSFRLEDFHSKAGFWQLCPARNIWCNAQHLHFEGETLYRPDWEDCLATTLSHGGWMWPLSCPLRNSTIQHPCGLGATCKDLGRKVLSHLELGPLDTMVGSPVCYLGDQVLSSLEICEFLCYSCSKT